jgi:hypothetical protein
MTTTWETIAWSTMSWEQALAQAGNFFCQDAPPAREAAQAGSGVLLAVCHDLPEYRRKLVALAGAGLTILGATAPNTDPEIPDDIDRLLFGAAALIATGHLTGDHESLTEAAGMLRDWWEHQ